MPLFEFNITLRADPLVLRHLDYIEEGIMAIEQTVDRLVAAVAATNTKIVEVAATLRELAELARAGASLAELEAKLTAAAADLESGVQQLAAAEDETDPTPDTPPA
jgi:fructoselysine-6-P-deglycase FrlB-like protein